jgi:hypothetical protein
MILEPEDKTMNTRSTTNNTPTHRNLDGSESKRRVRPKRELMICLGWLRLFHAITLEETQTIQDEIPALERIRSGRVNCQPKPGL